MDVDEDLTAARSPPAPIPPLMYRWMSTSRTSSNAEKHMILSFSVPPSVLHDDQLSKVVLSPSAPPASHPICDVDGCRSERKYRLVGDWSRGACGMAHLNILEGMAMQVA